MEERELKPEEDKEKEENLEYVLHPDDLPQEGSPFLGKLEQDGSLVCPESSGEPQEEVDGLVLYQTIDQQSMENSLDAEAFLHEPAKEFLQMKEVLGGKGGPCSPDPADQADAVPGGHMDLSVDESAVTQAHTGVTEKVGKQLGAKTSEVEFGDIYSEFVAPSPSAFVSKQSNGAKSAEKGGGANKEVPMDQGQYQGLPEGQSFPGDSGDFKSGALSLHQESKHNLLVSPTLPANPAGPSDFKPSPQTDSDEKKSSLLAVRVKLEDTTETHEDFLSESSESKPGHFLPYRVKTEVLVNKPELKSELLDLKLAGKHENLDSKPEHLPFVKCSDDMEVDVKPSTLSFSTYLEGVKLKTEEKPESFRTAVHHETSAVKPELKMETLEYNTFPDSSEAKPGIKTESLECPPQSGVKTEMKEEMLEADSTVLTPKFELPDGGADNTEGPVEKVQLKAEGSCAAGTKASII